MISEGISPGEHRHQPRIMQPDYVIHNEKARLVREHLQVEEADVHYIVTEPKEITSSTKMIAISPGWALSIDSAEHLAKALAERGFLVSVAENPQQGDIHTRKDSKFGEEIDRQTAVQGRVIHHVKEAYPQIDPKNVIGLGYSMGAIAAIELADQNPELFSQLILLMPAGLDSQSELTLAGKFSGEILGTVLSSVAQLVRTGDIAHAGSLIGSLIGTARHVLENPVRSNEQVKAIANADIIDRLIYMRKSGVPITIIAGGKDSVFPHGDIARLGLGEVVEMPTANHFSPVTDAELSAKQIDLAIKKQTLKELRDQLGGK